MLTGSQSTSTISALTSSPSKIVLAGIRTSIYHPDVMGRRGTKWLLLHCLAVLLTLKLQSSRSSILKIRTR